MSLLRHPLSRTLALAGAAAVVLAAVAAPATATPTASATPPQTAAATLARTTTTLTSPRATAYTAQTGGITARVKGQTALGVPTGWVDLYVDGDWWWSEPLDTTGRAKIVWANIPEGTHTLTASYSGDAVYAVSTSAGLVQTVLATAPTTAVTYTSSTVAPGGVSRLVVAATNQTPVTMPSMAMGLLLPPGAAIVSTPPGVGCRRAYPNLFYCLTSARPGVTRTIVLTVTAPATPSNITTSAYSRNIDTMEETGATATLTVG